MSPVVPVGTEMGCEHSLDTPFWDRRRWRGTSWQSPLTPTCACAKPALLWWLSLLLVESYCDLKHHFNNPKCALPHSPSPAHWFPEESRWQRTKLLQAVPSEADQLSFIYLLPRFVEGGGSEGRAGKHDIVASTWISFYWLLKAFIWLGYTKKIHKSCFWAIKSFYNLNQNILIIEAPNLVCFFYLFSKGRNSQHYSGEKSALFTVGIDQKESLMGKTELWRRITFVRILSTARNRDPTYAEMRKS